MKFAEIIWLYLILVIVPFCVLLNLWGSRQKRSILSRIVAPRLHDLLTHSLSHRKRTLKTVLFSTGVLVLMVALARPLFGLQEVQVERAGVDVILALDVSRSMMAQDVGTNRLAAAKKAIKRLLDLPSHDRYGLIVFSGDACLMAPVTLDHMAVQRSLDAISITSISKSTLR